MVDQAMPILMVSWWCTIFSTTIILVRLAGRWVRVGIFLCGDWLMLSSVIPLLLRMGMVHIALREKTNYFDTDMVEADDNIQRQRGSQAILAARVFLVVFLWIVKLAILDVLARVVAGASSTRSKRAVTWVRLLLCFTLAAAIVTVFVDCRPFSQAWQVTPKPASRCLAARTPIIVAEVSNAITNAILVVIPLPAILSTQMSAGRKCGLSLLFALPAAIAAVNVWRLTTVLAHGGLQPYRSLSASLEILFTTGLANAVVIGSLVRDKGPRRPRYIPDMLPPANDSETSGLQGIGVPGRPEAALVAWKSNEMNGHRTKRTPTHFVDELELEER